MSACDVGERVPLACLLACLTVSVSYNAVLVSQFICVADCVACLSVCVLLLCGVSIAAGVIDHNRL